MFHGFLQQKYGEMMDINGAIQRQRGCSATKNENLNSDNDFNKGDIHQKKYVEKGIAQNKCAGACVCVYIYIYVCIIYTYMYT